MAWVNISNDIARPVEHTSLETHVELSLQRQKILEGRISQNEDGISKIEEEILATKKFLIRFAWAALATLGSALFALVQLAIPYLKNN